MDCNWLEGLQSIYQLSNPITLFEPLIFPRSDVLMERNEAGLPAAIGLLTKKTGVLTFSTRNPGAHLLHNFVFKVVIFVVLT